MFIWFICVLDLTGSPNGYKFDRWPVDRPVDRQVILTYSLTPTANFFRVLVYRSLSVHLVLEEANLRVRVVTNSCGSSVRGAASAS